eukprot:1576830-Rhodomonas_salina.1
MKSVVFVLHYHDSQEQVPQTLLPRTFSPTCTLQPLWLGRERGGETDRPVSLVLSLSLPPPVSYTHLRAHETEADL